MRRPVVQIIGQSGNDLIPGWGEALLAVRFTDNEGGEADEIEIDFSVSLPPQPPPAEGTQYRLLYGWDVAALKDAGLFTYQNSGLHYDAESGWVLTVVARSADFVDGDKAADSEHFEETTAGEIFKKLATGVGKSAKVHASLASTQIPYRLRYQQSAVGFAQDLADELGGALKVANGQWLVTVKNGGETASGTAMPAIVISVSDLTQCDLNTEASPKFGNVAANHFDPEQGLLLQEIAKGLGQAARYIGLHPAASPVEAKAKSKSDAISLSRATITGSVTIEGDMHAMAGAAVTLDGFGAWGGFDLVAPVIEHEFTFDESGGWLMTVEIAAKTAAKGT